MGNKDLVIQIIADDSQFNRNYLVRGIAHVTRLDAVNFAVGKWNAWLTQMERKPFAELSEVRILEVIVD